MGRVLRKCGVSGRRCMYSISDPEYLVTHRIVSYHITSYPEINEILP